MNEGGAVRHLAVFSPLRSARTCSEYGEFMSINIKKIAVILFVFLWCIFLHYRRDLNTVFHFDPTPTPHSPTKLVLSNDLPVVQQWKWKGRVPSPTTSPSRVMIIKNRVIIVDYNNSDRIITVFNAQSGEIVWRSDYIRNITSLYADNKRVYIGTIRYTLALDLVTGKELWQGTKQRLDKKDQLYVYSKEKYIEVYDAGEDKLYLLKADTGETFEEITQSSLYFRTDNISYLRLECCLKAVDNTTKKTLWRHDFQGRIFLWPTFMNNVMLVNINEQLLGLHTKTGDIIWQSPAKTKFITPIALGGNIAYAIQHDATIVGLDPETGKKIGTITMAPNRTREDDGGYVTHYAISASDQFVAAYYGNSQELFVFKRTDGKLN